MRIFDTETYKKFYSYRGPCRSSVKEFPVYSRDGEVLLTESDYDAAEEEFYEVKDILAFLNANISRALNRDGFDLEVDIDLDYLFELGEEQEWQCALTGKQLEFKRGGTFWLGKWCNPNSCTIDRIDSSKGYIKGNIQLVTWKANCLKQHLDNDEFIEFCIEVTDHHMLS